MRYRKLDANGDYQAGHGTLDFWHDQPEAVAQAVLTRLLLFAGEWFLDSTEGTPWGGFPLNPLVVAQGRILGAHTQLTRDVAIKTRVLQTQGVANISDYASQVDPTVRGFSVELTVTTIYGQAAMAAQLPTTPPQQPSQAISEWDGGGSIWDSGASLWDRRTA